MRLTTSDSRCHMRVILQPSCAYHVHLGVMPAADDAGQLSCCRICRRGCDDNTLQQHRKQSVDDCHLAPEARVVLYVHVNGLYAQKQDSRAVTWDEHNHGDS